ncbi:MAG: polysaccharide deacetylase family protein [Clostridia bacterium]|nr:polysaccharide deacetylase family protein [Clostridia bacterium]
MKRFFVCLLTLALLLPGMGRAEKASSFPAFFQVKYQVKERKFNSDRCFVSKEYVTTALSQVDEEINALVDGFDDALAGQMTPDKGKNPKRNSRLDIHVVNTRSGESALSFLVLARETYQRKQKQSPIAGRVYDMATGQKITLNDLFPEDSEAWTVLSDAVREQLNAYFPAQDADPEALSALCSQEALLETPFMLGPVCLSLHYEAKALYPKQGSLMRVTVPYSALKGMMTEYGQKQTDNSNYKMVALTFDDGPAHTTTATLLNNLRHNGAQATFFIVGDRIEEHAYIVLRENDENHSIQSHHYKHTDTSKSTVGRIQSYTEKMYKAMTETFGLGPLMLRAPYGIFDYFIKAKVNLPLIEWDVDTKDWTGKSSAAVLNVVKKEVKEGSIILMHDIKDHTPESGRLAAEWLYDNGYMCVTVEDLFMNYGQEMVPNKIYYRVKTDGAE